MLSVSMLSGYLYCPRKVYLQYALKIFEPPKPSLALGTIRHKVFEEANKAEESIVKSIRERMSLDDIRSVYKTRYFGILKDQIAKNKAELERFDITQSDAFSTMSASVQEEAEQRARNVFGFIEEKNVFGDELWEKLTPKIMSEFSVSSESLGIRGIVDRIEMHDDFMIPIELKTGKSPDEGAWPSHKLQIAAYMAMLSEKQREVKQGRIVYLDSNKEVDIANNPFILEEVKKAAERTRQMLGSRIAPDICRNPNKCSACGLKRQCHNEEFIRNRAREVFEGNNKKQKI